MREKIAELEWLQTNQLGSFSMGCVDRVPRRKYHSLLTVRDPGYGESLNVLAELGECVSAGRNNYFLHNIRHTNEAAPQQCKIFSDFSCNPKPRWIYRSDDFTLERAIELDPGQDTVSVHYEFADIKAPLTVTIEPFFVCRPIHDLTRENPFLDGAIRTEPEGISFKPYPPLPRLFMRIIGHGASFSPSGRWDKNIYYSIDHERGYEPREDFYCPGTFKLHLDRESVFHFQLGLNDLSEKPRHKRQIKPPASSTLKTSASSYLFTGKDGFNSIIAGYPWFGEWARDTMISLPGLCLSTGKIKEAKKILASHASLFMKYFIPNAPTKSERPQNIMVDSPLLFIRAVQLFSEYADKDDLRPLMPAVFHILTSLKEGRDDRAS
ncbi:MAG: glycogen debranching enzyme N-terminal domain-containing protein, partial [Bdellovibrionota bacterium]